MTRSLIYLILILFLHSLFAKDRDRNASTTPTMTEKAISAGFNHTLIIQEGAVFSWGENTYGQLGDSTITISGAGVLAVGLDHIIAVSAGRRHSMALRADGKVFVWGDNTYGQLGTVGVGSAIPVQLSGVSDIIDIQAGDFHCMALKSDGTVISWGINNLGELGQGFFSPSALPGNVVNSSGTGILNGVTLISAGARHSLAIKDGRVLGWGDNLNTQLGRSPSSFASRNTPIAVRKKIGFFPIPLTDVIALSAGETHSIATDVEGNLWTWGEGVYGQLGIGGPIDPLDPTTYRREYAESVASKVRTMAAGYSHSTFIDSKGELHFFGANFHGQFGIPLTTARVFSDSTVSYDKSVALACGADFTIILKSDGSLVGAGDNAHSQFGIHPGPPAIPSFVPFFNKVDRLAQLATNENSYILRSDGTVWSMGDSLAIGFTSSTLNVTTPTQIVSLSDIISIGGTSNAAFALDVNGNVWTWGDNRLGVCGTGSTTTIHTTPVKIPTLSDIVFVEGAVQAGYNRCLGDCSHASAIDVNGDLFMWGENNHYELGDGTRTRRLTPIRTTAAGKVFSTSLAEDNSFALYADNTVQVWGRKETAGIGVVGSYAITPVGIATPTRFKSISTNRRFRMGLSTDGRILVWGVVNALSSRNFFNICQLGGTFYRVNTPTFIHENEVSPDLIRNVKRIYAGDNLGTFIMADGATWAWGVNNFAELGRGFISKEEFIPQPIACNAPGYSVSMYSSLSVETHVLANRVGIVIDTWGGNYHGELGLGFTSRYESACTFAFRTSGSEVVLSNEELDNLIQVYPNPVRETLHVKLTPEVIQEVSELRLIDASGRIVYKQKEVFKEMSLPVSRYDEGIYILKIGSVNRRIIIRK